MATNAEEFLLRLKSNVAPIATRDEKALAALDAQIRAAQRAMQGLNAKAAATAAAAAAQQQKFTAAAAALRKVREGSGGSVDVAQERAARARMLAEGRAFRVTRERAKAAEAAVAAGRRELGILRGARPEFAKQAAAAKRAAEAKERWKERTQHLGAAVHAMGGPMSSWLHRMQSIAPIAELGAAAVVSLGAVALSVVLVGGLLAAYGALVTFGLGAAAAARSARILGDALSGVSQRPGQEFVAVVNQLSRQVPLAKDKIQELAKEMALLKLGGRDLQAGLSSVAIVTSALGDGAGRNVRGIVEQSAALRRFTLGARDLWGQYQMLAGTGLTKADVIGALAKQLGRSAGDVEKMLLRGQIKLKDGLRALEAASKGRFGKTIAAQMLDFDTQISKVKESFAGMFSGLNLEPALQALQAFFKIFDEGTVSGKVMKAIVTAGLQKILDLITLALPIARRFFYGLATGALELYIALAPTVFRIAKFVKDLVGSQSAFSAFDAGKAVVYAMAVAFGVVAASITIALLPLTLLGAAIYASVRLGIAAFGLLSRAVDAVSEAIDAAESYISSISWLDLGYKLVMGLVKGILSGGPAFVGSIVDLAKSGINAFRGVNEIKSPSGLYRRVARQIPPGAAGGIEQASPLFARSVSDMSLAAAPQLGTGMSDIKVSAPSGGGPTVNFYGNVSIGGDDGPSAKERAREFFLEIITGARMGGAAEVGT
jgi:hypothetical protein